MDFTAPSQAEGSVRNKRRLIALVPSTVEETTQENFSSGKSESSHSRVFLSAQKGLAKKGDGFEVSEQELL